MSVIRTARRSLLLVGAILAADPCAASDRSDLDGIFKSWVVSQSCLDGGKPVATYAIEYRLDYDGASKGSANVVATGTRTGNCRIELNFSSGSALVCGFDGFIGWTARPSVGFGLWNVTDPLTWQSSVFAAIALVPPGSSHYVKPREPIGGISCLVAGVQMAGMPDETCYFDPSMRLVRIVRPKRPNDAASRKVTIDLGDYRRTEGLWIPFLLRVDDGGSVSTIRRSKVTLNPTVDWGSFVLPTEKAKEANDVIQILLRMERSSGTKEAMSKIYSRVTHMEVDSPTTQIHGTQVIYQKLPALVVVESQVPGIGWQAIGFDGQRGWSSSEIEGNRFLKPDELAQLLFSTSVNGFSRLAASCPYRQVVGDRIVGGKAATAVVMAAAQGPAATYYFEKETGRLVRISANTKGLLTTVDFTDFRTVNDVEVPFRVVTETPIMKTVNTVLSVENNVPISDEIFKQRNVD